MSRVVEKDEFPLLYEPVRKKTLKEQLYAYFAYICEARLRFGFNGNFITAGGIELPLSSLIKTDNSLHPYVFKNFPGAHGSSWYSYYSNGMSFPRGGNEPGELDAWDIVDYKPTDKYHFSIGMPQYISDTTGGFKTIADKCFGGELFGKFELLNGTKFYSYCLDKTQNYYRACDTDNGIGVIDGSAGNVLGTKNQIRVYPIDVVKGMEFDVVFFHNIDKNSSKSDMIKRYIYVGVSRAAFFLGITLEEDISDITKYFAVGEKWDRII